MLLVTGGQKLNPCEIDLIGLTVARYCKKIYIVILKY